LKSLIDATILHHIHLYSGLTVAIDASQNLASVQVRAAGITSLLPYPYRLDRADQWDRVDAPPDK
jgi:hypothetical protein